jgi:hypothetical protein
VYVYALLDGPPPGPLPSGLAGEPVHLLARAGIVAAFGEMATAPPVEAEAIRAHDATARAIAEGVGAVLPSRFGALLEGEAALARFLEDNAGPLRDALDRVRGCRQMILRLSTAAGAEPPPVSAEAPVDPPAAGPGTRYLRERAARDPGQDPRVKPVLAALAPVTRETRVQGHQHPPLIASVYHLVRREDVGDYAARVAVVAAAHSALHIAASGPWLPYAFAPESLL